MWCFRAPIIANAAHLPPQARQDALFEAADVALGDAQHIGDLLLRVLPLPVKAEAQADDLALAPLKPLHRLEQHPPLGVVLERAADLVLVGAEDVRKQQLVAVPVGVERLVDAQLRALRARLAQMHEDLVLDAAAGIGRELDVLSGVEGVDGLDQPDRADGDQILDVDAGVLEAARDEDHQAQVVLDEEPARGVIADVERADRRLLVLSLQGRRQGVAAADVKNRRRLDAEDGKNPLPQEKNLRLA